MTATTAPEPKPGLDNLARAAVGDVLTLIELNTNAPANASAELKAHALAKLAELPLSDDDWLRLLALARAQAVFTAFQFSLPADAKAHLAHRAALRSADAQAMLDSSDVTDEAKAMLRQAIADGDNGLIDELLTSNATLPQRNEKPSLSASR